METVFSTVCLDQLRYNSELHDFAEDHEEFRTKVVTYGYDKFLKNKEVDLVRRSRAWLSEGMEEKHATTWSLWGRGSTYPC